MVAAVAMVMVASVAVMPAVAVVVMVVMVVVVAVVPRRVCGGGVLAAALRLHVCFLLPLLLLHGEAPVPVDTQPPALDVQPLQLVVGVARLLVCLVRHERAALPVARPLVLQEALLRHAPEAAEELAHLGLREGVGDVPHKKVAPADLWGGRARAGGGWRGCWGATGLLVRVVLFLWVLLRCVTNGFLFHGNCLSFLFFLSCLFSFFCFFCF